MIVPVLKAVINGIKHWEYVEVQELSILNHPEMKKCYNLDEIFQKDDTFFTPVKEEDK